MIHSSHYRVHIKGNEINLLKGHLHLHIYSSQDTESAYELMEYYSAIKNNLLSLMATLMEL